MAKPASGATLDSGNALFANMLAIYAFLEGSGTSTADSKGSNTGTLSSGGLWSTDSAGDVCIAPTIATIHRPVALASTIGDPAGITDFSYAWRAKQTADNGSGMLAGLPSGTDNYFWMRGANYFAVNSSANLSTAWTSVQPFTTEKDYVLTFDFTVAVSNLWRLYVNGTLSAEGSVSLSGAFTMDTIGNGFSSDTLGLVGTISYFYVWSGRVLSGAEATTLAANPYAIFTGGGGGGSNWGPMLGQRLNRVVLP